MAAATANPTWEKARQALEKLQSPEKEEKTQENSTVSAVKASIQANNNFFPHQQFVYGHTPPPPPYAFGGIYQRFPCPNPYGLQSPVTSGPYPPPQTRFPTSNEVKSSSHQGQEKSENPAKDDSNSNDLQGSHSFNQPPSNFQNFHRGTFDGGDRFPRAGPNIHFRFPKKNFGQGNNAFQKFSPRGQRRWPQPYPHRNQTPRHQAPQQPVRPWGNPNPISKSRDIAENTTEAKDEDSKENAQPSQRKQEEKAAIATAEWPPNLKAYVQRCFGSVSGDEQKDEIEKWLKDKLTSVFNKGEVNSVDWDKEPLPPFITSKDRSLPLQRDRSEPWAGSHNSDDRRGSFQSGRHRRWSPPGFSRRNRSRSRSRDRSRSRSRSHSRSPYYRRERRRRHRSRSRSSTSSLSSDLSDDFKIYNDERVHAELEHGRGRGKRKGHAMGRGRGKSPEAELEPISFGRKGKNKKKKSISNGMFKMAVGAEKLNKRAARFADTLGKAPRSEPLTLQINSFNSDSDDSEMDWSSYHIVGTCQNLEKPYLRLTSAPDPSQVRPVSLLHKSLDMVKKHWKTNQNYRYACEQLKSIRQDLTVQCVRSEFVVEVYEVHARVALEKGDREEFNQCQTQLKALYNELTKDGHTPGSYLEFTAYRIIYNIFVKNSLANTTELAHLTKEMKQDESIKFALQMCEACTLNNYHRVFKLNRKAPKMSGFLVDWFSERVRKDALKSIIKSYRPTITVDFIQSTLGFSDKSSCVEWLKEKGVSLTAADTKLDGKANMGVLPSL